MKPFPPLGTLLLPLAAAAGMLLPPTAHAQVSLPDAVALALAHSPKVHGAQADVAKARAVLSESKDVFIPPIDVGAGLGDAFGYSPNPPTLFSFATQSLAYSASQFDYIRSARSGVRAATLSLDEAREGVIEDTADAFAALAHDQDRESALGEEMSFANRLVSISSDRFAAGRDTALERNGAELTRAQIHLAMVHNESQTASDRFHLAALLGVPAVTLQIQSAFPRMSDDALAAAPESVSPGVQAAFASALAKEQQAHGDARYMYRPQLIFAVQYNLYATFSDSFKKLQAFNPSVTIGTNEVAFGVQVTVPLFDKLHRAKERESAADAAHALHSAEDIQVLARDGRDRLTNTLTELRAREDVGRLEQERAQMQLDALLTELNAPPVEGRPPLSPRDEQTARIAEREKYLSMVDTTYQVRQTEIQLLRQTGGLEHWIAGSPGALLPAPLNLPSTLPRTP